MKKFKYLVLGTGVGKAIAYYLANCEDTREVMLADVDYDKTGAVIKSLPPTKRFIHPVELDISKPWVGPIYKYFSNSDTIISAVPAKYNLDLAEVALEAEVNFCDLGGVVEVTNDMLLFNDSAIFKGVSVIPDCGLMPGLGMIMAQLLIPKFKNIRDLIIYAGGLPQNPEPPLYYQKVFSVEGLEHICYDRPDILEGSEIKSVEPFSGYERLKIKELAKFGFNGVVEGFSTAGASISPLNFQKLGVVNFSEQTVRWPGFVKFVKGIPRSEFKSTMNSVLKTTTANNPDLVWMEVCAAGTNLAGQESGKSLALLDLFDTKTNFSAMERTTGFTTAAIARMAAQKKTLCGVNTPDNALDYEQKINLCDELSSSFQIFSK